MIKLGNNTVDYLLKPLNIEIEGTQSHLILFREHFKALENTTDLRIQNLDKETNNRFLQDIEQFRELNDRQSDYK